MEGNIFINVLINYQIARLAPVFSMMPCWTYYTRHYAEPEKNASSPGSLILITDSHFSHSYSFILYIWTTKGDGISYVRHCLKSLYLYYYVSLRATHANQISYEITKYV